jgi:cyclophilin family peptidyl-prolyl cis-trans isomerase
MRNSIRLLLGLGCCAALAAHAQVPPSLSVSNVTVLAGRTFTLPLDGADSQGSPLTFTVLSNNMPSLTTALVTTNRSLRLNVGVQSISIVTNVDSSSYTTNVSLGQGTNVLFVSGAGTAGCNGTYVWDATKSAAGGAALGAYTNTAGVMFIFVHPSFSLWDFNDDTDDYYQSSSPTNTWTVYHGAEPAPKAIYDGNTPGELFITTNTVITYTTNTTTTTGDLMLELFEHLTPKTTARIISLVNSNFYNGLTFHRVIQSFMAQGGDPSGDGTGGSGVKFNDEFVLGLTFEGFGQLALANSGFLTSSPLGRDNNDSQFFITAPNLSFGTNGVAPPYHLNYRHTIFGQVTHGFDFFGQLMATPVDGNSKPVAPVIINSASITNHRQGAVLYLTAPTNTGTATLTVRAQNTNGLSTQVTFQVDVIAHNLHDPPFFYSMPTDLVVTQNDTIAFPFVWAGGSSNNLGLWNGDTGASLYNVQAYLSDGYIYLTPTALGRMNLLFSIYDQYDHNGDGVIGSQLSSDIRAAQEFDTQSVVLNVVQPNLGIALNMPGAGWESSDSYGGSATWFAQTGVTHDGMALQSGNPGTVTGTNSAYSFVQIATNGPGSIIFWWKASTGTNAYLGFFTNGNLQTSISGVTGWQQFAHYFSTTGTLRFTWVYNKAAGANGGSDAGWLDQVAWVPCPAATNVPQLFFQDGNGLLASWILNSTGGFEFARIPANTGGWALKAAGDIDGDGVSDLLFQNTASDTGGWFLNADGTTRDARFWWNIGGWEIKACGDFEGTGRGQVFFQTADGRVAYWKLETNGAFQAAVQLGSMAGWKLRGIGELDGDGHAELFWQNAAGTVAIWYHNPDDTLRAAIAFNTGEWALSGVTDVDHDGVCDLIWQTPDTRTGGWFMQTNSVARDARFWWPTGGWKLKAAGR